MRKEKGLISSSTLHIIGVICMFLDHAGYVLWPGVIWLRWIGRLAFPIFGFMIAEGSRRTSNRLKYELRLFVMALISEVPFSLMCSGKFFDLGHRNVMYTLLLGLLTLDLLDIMVKRLGLNGLRLRDILLVSSWLLFCFVVAEIGNLDYGGEGVLTVFIFGLALYEKNEVVRAIQELVWLFVIGWVMLGGFKYYLILDNGNSVVIPMQILWILSLIPINMYSGEKGIESKGFKYAMYLFYPVHIMFLVMIRWVIR